MSTKRKPVSNSSVLESKKLRLDDVLEPDIINFISVPSLQTMAIVKIATTLCNQAIIRDKVRQVLIEFDPSDLQFNKKSWIDSFVKIRKAVINYLFQLSLPGVLKNNVSHIIRPIVLQIRESLRHDLSYIDYFDSICWTSEGTIDKIKTLKQLIEENNGQHTHSIFKLSCNYCLEESITDSWLKLPNKFKIIYMESGKMYKEYDCHLIAYWIHALHNNLGGLLAKIKRRDRSNIYNCNDSIYRNMVNLSIKIGNDLALRYFWEKLTEAEITSNLTQWVNDAAKNRLQDYLDTYLAVNKWGNVLYYLISKVSGREEQKEILANNQNAILISLFYDWPWQTHLLPTIRVIWERIDFKCYAKLMNTVSECLKCDTQAEEILSRLWYESPLNLKKQMIQSLTNFFSKINIFYNLLMAESIGTANALLEYANVEEQKHITFYFVENWRFDSIIRANKIDLFEKVFLSKLSETDVNRIKAKIVSSHGEKVSRIWIYENNWNSLKMFLNWACNSDQIDIFKEENIDKEEITFMILYHQGDYELVDKFLDWCFDSNEKILQFKKEVLACMPKMVKLGEEDWVSFEMFLDWCFDSEEEIDCFKSYLLKSHEFWRIISDSIAYSYKFEFVDKLLSWCCNPKELEQFKADFVLSAWFRGPLQRFVSNYKVYDSKWSNWELIKKLMKCFSPLKEDIKIKLKMQISSSIDFEDFRSDFRHISVTMDMLDLFRLLDDDSYNLSDYVEDDNNSSDDKEDINLNTNCLNDVILVLSEILNELKEY